MNYNKPYRAMHMNICMTNFQDNKNEQAENMHMLYDIANLLFHFLEIK